MSLCASVYMCFAVTCWERADLLALVCGVCCEFVTFPLVSWVRCGTWLYRFLIFAPLLTLLQGPDLGPNGLQRNFWTRMTKVPLAKTLDILVACLNRTCIIQSAKWRLWSARAFVVWSEYQIGTIQYTVSEKKRHLNTTKVASWWALTREKLFANRQASLLSFREWLNCLHFVCSRRLN